jgi:hypothetical protein
MRDGVRALMDRDAAFDRWLIDDVVSGHQEYLADPSKGVPADVLLDNIESRRAARQVK